MTKFVTALTYAVTLLLVSPFSTASDVTDSSAVSAGTCPLYPITFDATSLPVVGITKTLTPGVSSKDGYSIQAHPILSRKSTSTCSAGIGR